MSQVTNVSITLHLSNDNLKASLKKELNVYCLICRHIFWLSYCISDSGHCSLYSTDLA